MGRDESAEAQTQPQNEWNLKPEFVVEVIST